MGQRQYNVQNTGFNFEKKKYCGQNNLFIVKSILKMITHVLKHLQKKLNVLLQNLMRMEHFEIDI